MTDEDKTDWFPPEVKPVQRGFYEVKNAPDPCFGNRMYWGHPIAGCIADRWGWPVLFGFMTSGKQDFEWRGLTMDAAIGKNMGGEG